MKRCKLDRQKKMNRANQKESVEEGQQLIVSRDKEKGDQYESAMGRLNWKGQRVEAERKKENFVNKEETKERRFGTEESL